MTCLEPSEVADYLAARSTSTERARVESHLDRCGACREVLAELAKDRLPEPEPTVRSQREDENAATLPTDQNDDLALERGHSVGRYLVLEPLGKGGMGVVYAAYDPELDRRVALKLLRPGAWSGDEGQARLLREAQAMARLSHPNVVSVFDVGTCPLGVFLAMELAEGTTARAWLKETRAWQKTLEVYLKAGEGLCAAHAAGLVHRDFKPDNVLVSPSGAVRVMDFGLARAVGELPPSPAALPPGQSGPRSLDVPLTEAGALIGTPAYLPPEGHAGKALDERADQYSFCVALYEALWGTRPFSGATFAEYRAQVLEGRVLAPPERPVPAHVRAAVLKGLAVDPAARFKTLRALLDTLVADPSARWRRRLVRAAVAAAGLFLVGLAAAFGWAQRTQCRGAERSLIGAWDDSARQAVRRAFLSTERPFAEAAFRDLDRQLSAYAQAWIEQRTEACEATRRGEQSAHLLDLRTICLDRRRDELAAVVRVLQKTDARTLERAAALPQELEPLARCQEAQTLTAQPKLPDDPASQTEVKRQQAVFTEARAHQLAGHYQEAERLAQGELASARGVGYAPNEAEALGIITRAQESLGRYKDAEATARQAVAAAERAHLGEATVELWLVYAGLVGLRGLRYDDGHAWLDYAEARIAGLGGDDRLLSHAHQSRGQLLQAEGRSKEALASLHRALTLRERVAPSPSIPVAQTLNSLGNVHYSLGENEEARAAHERALAIKLELLGPDHPSVAVSYINLANALGSLGRPKEQLEHQERARALLEKSAGTTSSTYGMLLLNMAGAHRRLDNLREAERLAHQSLEVLAKALGTDHPHLANAHLVLCEVEYERSHFAASARQAEVALELRERRLPPEHPDTMKALFALGRARLANRQPQAALPLLERAADIGRKKTVELPTAPEVDFLLARALWESGKDRPRALELARKTAPDYRALKAHSTGLGEGDLDRWLASFGP